MSYNPETGLLYIPARETSMAFRNAPDQVIGNFDIGVDWTGGQEAYEREGNTIEPGSRDRMVAWDPVAAEEVWAVEDEGSGGILTTAGDLIFKPNAGEQEFVAYDATSGERLWSAPTVAGGSAGAISYEYNGEQYVAHVVGGGGPGGYYAPSYARLLAYKVGGTAQLPPREEFTQRPFAPPPETAAADVIALGQQQYDGACGMCHGGSGIQRGNMFPDLRRTPLLHTAEGFSAVVLDGILADRGMRGFNEVMTEEQVEAIRHYLINQAIIAASQPDIGGFGPAPEPEDEEEAESTHTVEN